jgi:hypothetical protein
VQKLNLPYAKEGSHRELPLQNTANDALAMSLIAGVDDEASSA